MLGVQVSVLVLAASLGAQQATTAPRFVEQPGVQEFTGEMLAQPAATAELADVEAALAGYQILEYAPGPQRYHFRVEGKSEQQSADELMATGLFEFVTPNWRVFPVGCPDDPLLGNQWHHNANRMNSCAAWSLHTGKFPVTVAICDTGIRKTHQDLIGNRREGYNAVNRVWERAGGLIDDINGHGTNTTGCAAANGNNGIGVSGVGWNLFHRMMRVSNDSGGGSSISTLVHAAEKAIQSGDKVASVSYSGVSDPAVRSSGSYIQSIGGILVWAAGNDSANLNWGNRDNDDVLVVGATDSNDSLASFSATGRSVDFVAPGVSVYTTSSSSDSSYGSVSGTSFSCPLAAGLCALLFSADPTLTPDQVEDMVKAGCDDLGTGGVDDTFGYGRIEVNGALSQVTNIGEDMILLLSLKVDTTLKGLSLQNRDIFRYHHVDRTIQMEFDSSDVFSATSNLDAFTRLADGTFLMSWESTETVPGVGTVEDVDLVQFTPTSLGTNTAGTFSLYFDGSDVDLTSGTEDINGIAVDSNGDLLVSFAATVTVGAITAADEDVLRFDPTSLGTNTAGTWSWFFDGTDANAKLGQVTEAVDAIAYCASQQLLILSTVGNFRTPVTLVGDDHDLLCFDVYGAGSNTTGWMTWLLNGGANGFAGTDIDGVYLFD